VNVFFWFWLTRDVLDKAPLKRLSLLFYRIRPRQGLWRKSRINWRISRMP